MSSANISSLRDTILGADEAGVMLMEVYDSYAAKARNIGVPSMAELNKKPIARISELACELLLGGDAAAGKLEAAVKMEQGIKRALPAIDNLLAYASTHPDTVGLTHNAEFHDLLEARVKLAGAPPRDLLVAWSEARDEDAAALVTTSREMEKDVADNGGSVVSQLEAFRQRGK